MSRKFSGWIFLAITLGVGLLHGLLYVFLVPPWQHNDEPNHFEYVWLAAHRDGLPVPGDYDVAMSRAVVKSMWITISTMAWDIFPIWPRKRLSASGAGRSWKILHYIICWFRCPYAWSAQYCLAPASKHCCIPPGWPLWHFCWLLY